MTQPAAATPGAPAAPSTPAPAAPVTPSAPAPVVTPPVPTPPPGTPPPAATPPEKVEDLPPWAQKIISDTRKEAADHRAGKQVESERVKAILKAAGIESDDDDPVKVLETTRTERDTIAQDLYDLKVERALATACKRGGADEDLTVAVLASQGKLDELDLTAADFDAKLDALVKAAVDSNPKLKGGQAPSASGVSAPGGPGETADIDARIEAATKAGNHELAISLKRHKAYTPRA